MEEMNNMVSCPNTTIEAEIQECIALSITSVKERLRNGTATSQERAIFLKMASEREQVEIAKMRQEIEVQKAKIAHLEAQERTEQMFEDAIRAMKGYSGGGTDSDTDYSDVLGADYDFDI